MIDFAAPRGHDSIRKGLAPEGLAPEGLAPEGLAPKGHIPAVSINPDV
jgi:hypothetical protein